ncbi:nickel pincer cofactor biosynthesis protein LarB [Vibrio superstes]|uniref:Circadian phase modifier CpmA n=1 Tax=Vibrio superstes NBRC 103154 TaxID=1219062 RepID=A0A511QR86_9VIBR|nr:nickel pincer cofactor biosynthesis protein LarB [Vibrio superstes]GEM79092.1 circadian phase modifier CpmA [Vibrio superstes NBRC 103154]
MSDIIIDFDRKQRCGVEEAILCERKSIAQIESIIELGLTNQVRFLFTRLTKEKWSQLKPTYHHHLTYCALSNTAVLGEVYKLQRQEHQVAIVSGGSSDTGVCHEVLTTLNYHGYSASLYEDVGVSALWRLNNALEEINKAKVIIAVAGMEAALPTVLSGMTHRPIIAVPTSVGYGVSEGGQLALHSCLGSCAAGLMTVNIDNGFGAACAAIKLLNAFS